MEELKPFMVIQKTKMFNTSFDLSRDTKALSE